MSETLSAFHVLLQRGAPSDWQRVSAIAVECAPKLPLALVSKACRHGYGLIRLNLLKAEALALAEKLNAAGYAAQAIAAQDVVVPPRAYTLLRAEIAPEALRIQVGAAMEMQSVPWESLRVLHVGCVRMSGKALMPDMEGEIGTAVAAASVGLTALSLASGVGVVNFGMVNQLAAAARAPSGDSDAKPQEGETLLELFTIEPLVRLRIRQSKFSYDVLGGKRQPTARANFALVLAELQVRAPQAACTGLYPLAVSGRKIDADKFGLDETQHEQQLTALLTCERLSGLPR